jgi:hypothetical protein
VRVPNDKLSAVTEIIKGRPVPTNDPSLKSVTEIKTEDDAVSALLKLREYYFDRFQFASDSGFFTFVDAILVKTGTHKQREPIPFAIDVVDLEVINQTAPTGTGWIDKYINPENHEQWWSGRGRKPDWIYPYLPADGTGQIPESLLNPNPKIPLTRTRRT